MKCRKSNIFGRTKKAQGLSINTIIIVALALVVLVALISIFTNKAGWFSRETMNCVDSYKGTCEFNKIDGCPDDYIKQNLGKCFLNDGKIDNTRVCCVPAYRVEADQSPP